MFKYLLYLCGQFIANHLPLPFLKLFALSLSNLQYYCSFRDRRSVQNNLRSILEPHADIPAHAREVFRNFGRYLLEFFRLEHMLKMDYIKKHVEICNLERIQEVVDRGAGGGILLTAHVGNWEYGAMTVSLLGYPFVAVALPHKERPVNRFFNRKRALGNVTVLPTQHALKKCVEAVRSGRLIALASDRCFGTRGEVMSFLGRPTLIPKGAAVIAQKTGVGIVPIFLIRLDGDKFRLLVEEPIYPRSGATEEDGVRYLMEQYTGVMERIIRRYPSQWLMFREYGVAP